MNFVTEYKGKSLLTAVAAMSTVVVKKHSWHQNTFSFKNLKERTIMKTKITTAVLLGISSMASAQNPPSVPSIYNSGPASVILNMTDMRESERAAFALSEALLQATESVVYVKGCQSFSVPVQVYAAPDEGNNYIKDKTFGGIEIKATLQSPIAGFGQNVDVSQPTQGVLNGTPVQNIRGRYTYNNANNIMVGERTQIDVKGQNRIFDTFYSSVIKDFYHGNTYESGDFYEIFDWGLQSLSKFGYPVNKWWQKSKTVRDDGQQGCLVFQKDRLVGSSVCRITLSTVGYSQPDFFLQDGTLSVSRVAPNAADTQLNSCNVNPIFAQ